MSMILKHNHTKECGFSLVELIASLAIAGILAAALMTIVVTAMNGFSLSREAAGVTQKANLALARLRIELLNAEDITTAENDRVVYTSNSGIYEIERTGSTITLEKLDAPIIAAKTLVDNIVSQYGTDSFLTYEKEDASAWSTSDDFSELYAIKVKLKFSDYHADLDTTINPRNNRVRNAPLLVHWDVDHFLGYATDIRFLRKYTTKDSRSQGFEDSSAGLKPMAKSSVPASQLPGIPAG